MKINQLGRTGLKVSEICLGTMTFGNQADEATAFAIMDMDNQAGVTFFDTADVYPLGAISAVSGGRKRSSGAGSRNGARATASCWRPSVTARWGAARTTPGSVASISSVPARQACAASRLTTSTSIRFTAAHSREEQACGQIYHCWDSR